MENAQPEPSMEEILASIRRIISEDEEEQAAPTTAEEPKKPELTLKAAPQPVETQPATDESETKAEDLQEDAAQEAAPAENESINMMKQNVAETMSDNGEEEILDKATAEVASQAFRNLSQSVRISEGPGRTLEDIVVEMLRPMVKEWLDANLPAIVEEKVEEEVQRVARRRR
ncbi:DUF2497 domain-containing protein [Hyphococcus sp. DH-69]|uniref:DUF2497 domain-containing protein n=1 Tax=Hyphococcus formosus TaxID=3143534 RepID=UPI00398ACF3F